MSTRGMLGALFLMSVVTACSADKPAAPTAEPEEDGVAWDGRDVPASSAAKAKGIARWSAGTEKQSVVAKDSGGNVIAAVKHGYAPDKTDKTDPTKGTHNYEVRQAGQVASSTYAVTSNEAGVRTFKLLEDVVRSFTTDGGSEAPLDPKLIVELMTQSFQAFGAGSPFSPPGGESAKDHAPSGGPSSSGAPTGLVEQNSDLVASSTCACTDRSGALLLRDDGSACAWSKSGKMAVVRCGDQTIQCEAETETCTGAPSRLEAPAVPWPAF